MRSPDTVLALISGLDVVNNFAFLPHRRVIEGEPTPLLTLCNCYVSVCTAALGCPIAPMKANQQHAWLASNEGKLAGWMPVDPATAQQRGDSGYPTVAVETKPGHGHIALVVPADPTGPSGIYVSAAGAQNFVRALFLRSFGGASKAEFFTHN